MVVEEQKLELEKSLQLKEGDIKEKELQDRAVKRHVVEVERKCKKLEEELVEVKDDALHVCWEFKMNMENKMKDKEVKMEEDLVKLQSHVDVICAEKDKKVSRVNFLRNFHETRVAEYHVCAKSLGPHCAVLPLGLKDIAITVVLPLCSPERLLILAVSWFSLLICVFSWLNKRMENCICHFCIFIADCKTRA